MSATKLLAVQNHDELVLIPINDVVCIQANRNYSIIYYGQSKSLLASKTLKHFHKKVHHLQTFVRVHKSFIINVNHIRSISKHREVALDGIERTIPVSRRFKPTLMARINRITI